MTPNLDRRALIAWVRRQRGTATREDYAVAGLHSTFEILDAIAALLEGDEKALNGWREVGQEIQRVFRFMGAPVRADLLPDWLEPRIAELLPLPDAPSQEGK